MRLLKFISIVIYLFFGNHVFSQNIGYRISASTDSMSIDSSCYPANYMIDLYTKRAKKIFEKLDSTILFKRNDFIYLNLISDVNRNFGLLDCVNHYYGDQILGFYLSNYPNYKEEFYNLLSHVHYVGLWERSDYIRKFLLENISPSDYLFYEMVAFYELQPFVEIIGADQGFAFLHTLKMDISKGTKIDEEELMKLKKMALSARFHSKNLENFLLEFIHDTYTIIKNTHPENLEWFFREVVRNSLYYLNTKKGYASCAYLMKDSTLIKEPWYAYNTYRVETLGESYVIMLFDKVKANTRLENGAFRKAYLPYEWESVIDEEASDRMIELIQSRDDIWLPFVKTN